MKKRKNATKAPILQISPRIGAKEDIEAFLVTWCFGGLNNFINDQNHNPS